MPSPARPPGISILIARAPQPTSWRTHVGPARARVRSSTVYRARGSAPAAGKRALPLPGRPVHEAAAGLGAVGRGVLHHGGRAVHGRGEADPGPHLAGAGAHRVGVEGEQVLERGQVVALQALQDPAVERLIDPARVEPVSYTHLTLPTSDLV